MEQHDNQEYTDDTLMGSCSQNGHIYTKLQHRPFRFYLECLHKIRHTVWTLMKKVVDIKQTSNVFNISA